MEQMVEPTPGLNPPTKAKAIRDLKSSNPAGLENSHELHYVLLDQRLVRKVLQNQEAVNQIEMIWRKKSHTCARDETELAFWIVFSGQVNHRL